jgi:hypothetical protein
MRCTIPILFITATLLLGCHTPRPVQTQAAAPPPFQPMLITTFGTKTMPDGIWRIKVLESSLDLSRSAAYSYGKGMTISGWTTTGFDTASPWKAHAGWFVYTESDSRAWAYDGDRNLILDVEKPNGPNSSGTIYSSQFPCTVPAEVFSRLSKQKQKEIATNE